MFWTIFWIALLIIPAFWLASIVFTLAMYLIIGAIALVATGIAKLFERG